MTVHHIEVPTEPDAGTVVLDRDGYAWQRSAAIDAGWESHRRPETRSMGAEVSRKPWGHLLTDHGPLTQLDKPRGPGAEAVAEAKRGVVNARTTATGLRIDAHSGSL